MRFQPGRKMRIAPGIPNPRIYLHNAYKKTKDGMLASVNMSYDQMRYSTMLVCLHCLSNGLFTFDLI